jgi:hypothetical protein
VRAAGSQKWLSSPLRNIKWETRKAARRIGRRTARDLLRQSVNGAKGCGANLFPEGQIIAFPAIKVTLHLTLAPSLLISRVVKIKTMSDGAIPGAQESHCHFLTLTQHAR